MATLLQVEYIEDLLSRLGYSVQFAISECFGPDAMGPTYDANDKLPSERDLDDLSVKDASLLIDWLRAEDE
jgi:hypothetical protein